MNEIIYYGAHNTTYNTIADADKIHTTMPIKACTPRTNAPVEVNSGVHAMLSRKNMYNITPIDSKNANKENIMI